MTLCEPSKHAIFPRVQSISSSTTPWMEIIHWLLSGKSVSISVIDEAHDGVSGPERFFVEYFEAERDAMLQHADEVILTEYIVRDDCSLFSLGTLMSHRDTQLALDAGFPIFIIPKKSDERILATSYSFVRAIADNS